MAIDDIVTRIEGDATAEAEALLAQARTDAERTVAEARSRAAARAEQALERGLVAAKREAETLVAGARLAARDATLTARQALGAETLTRLEAALAALPDASYAELLAREIASAPLPAGTLRLGSADFARLRAALPAALASHAVDLSIEDAPADIERGVVLLGDRVRIEVSPASLVYARRAELEAEADRALFGEEG